MELDFDIQLLRTVLVIARTGSISAASEAMGLSQSAVTKQLQRIEEQLGVRLFERRARGVEVTHFGRALVERGELIARQFKDTVSELKALAGGEAGEIAIGAGPSWLHGPLSRALVQLVRKRPGVRVRVIAEPIDRMLDALRAGNLDVVLAPWVEDVDRSRVEWTPAIIDDLRVMARKGHPLVRQQPRSLKDLEAYGWVLSDPRNPSRRRLAAVFENEGLKAPAPMIESPSLSLLLHLVRHTDLLTVLPDLRFPWMSRGLAIVDSPAMQWRRSSGLFRLKDAVTTPALQAFLDELQKVVRRHYGAPGVRDPDPDHTRSRALAGLHQLGPAA